MSVASVAISQRAENLFPLPPRWPGWRFNFVEVLADYRYLPAAVMENAARAGCERGAGTLIRTAALGRFPPGKHRDKASKTRWTSGENMGTTLIVAHWLVFKVHII